MPSIEWKWSEWIPLAEHCALVAHTVGWSATETAQHCMATQRANQASCWHSLDITQERYTERKKRSFVAMATLFIYLSGQLSNAKVPWGRLERDSYAGFVRYPRCKMYEAQIWYRTCVFLIIKIQTNNWIWITPFPLIFSIFYCSPGRARRNCVVFLSFMKFMHRSCQ